MNLFNSQLNFKVNLVESITFTKCWILIIRGYSKAGLSSTKSSEIRDCKDQQQVRPSVVVDAVGQPLSTGKTLVVLTSSLLICFKLTLDDTESYCCQRTVHQLFLF